MKEIGNPVPFDDQNSEMNYIICRARVRGRIIKRRHDARPAHFWLFLARLCTTIRCGKGEKIDSELFNSDN